MEITTKSVRIKAHYVDLSNPEKNEDPAVQKFTNQISEQQLCTSEISSHGCLQGEGLSFQQ